MQPDPTTLAYLAGMIDGDGYINGFPDVAQVMDKQDTPEVL